ncbi:hypothetical protein AVEN_188184-1 [Araneus ventricosus]|uniref:Uncharacterized protein n=1 Tax=Araneus ventricosus TaxID=182803 RepID=A0A4Y2PQZ0_ARAVE|nr:hypothetical protein AVEN_171737-1 [Araneus ventricosus]GBN54328.1 hypothetical protein AVEN_188184-1 [Araneus ventricosus]
MTGARCGLAKSQLQGQKVQVRNPIPLKIRLLWGLLHVKSYVVCRRPTGVVRKFGEGVPAQVSPRHLTAVQNDEVRPQIALVQLRN